MLQYIRIIINMEDTLTQVPNQEWLLKMLSKEVVYIYIYIVDLFPQSLDKGLKICCYYVYSAFSK